MPDLWSAEVCPLGRLTLHLQAGYGQGEVLVTPVQIAHLVAAIADGGRIPNTHFVNDRQQPTQPQPELLSAESVAILGKAMRLVVKAGTGSKAMSAPAPSAGKTGTAEVTGAQSHAWFAGFVPADTVAARRIAFTVFIENGQYGGSVAAPVAADVVAARARTAAPH